MGAKGAAVTSDAAASTGVVVTADVVTALGLSAPVMVACVSATTSGPSEGRDGRASRVPAGVVASHIVGSAPDVESCASADEGEARGLGARNGSGTGWGAASTAAGGV